MNVLWVDRSDLEQLWLTNISEISNPLTFDNLDNWKSEQLRYSSNISSDNANNNTLIVLPQRTSLWWVSMDYFDHIMESTQSDLLWVICMKLTNPRWSQSRRWISYQNWQTNFNINIVFKKWSETTRSWDLQQKISVSIAETLTQFSWNRGVEIIPPFHYCIDKRKVAWHLVTQDQIWDQRIIRIWLGINTVWNIELAWNDDLWNWLFNGTNSLWVRKEDWIKIYQSLVERLSNNLISRVSKYDSQITKKFFDLLSVKRWDFIKIYKDNWTINFWDFIDQWVISDIDYEKWVFIVNNKNYDIWSYFFVKK